MNNDELFRFLKSVREEVQLQRVMISNVLRTVPPGSKLTETEATSVLEYRLIKLVCSQQATTETRALLHVLEIHCGYSKGDIFNLLNDACCKTSA